ncbi:hypothetical protein EYF80_022146 [Liparis tanakae]|uniref:Uncharacterized protein n=1 Tax=Liparis tanakae TaxID=230148 RepID=A0A4Z2HS94_9TELE|nr:hypothetical protein EYF80_022146 [Liparis tanakae]
MYRVSSESMMEAPLRPPANTPHQACTPHKVARSGPLTAQIKLTKHPHPLKAHLLEFACWQFSSYCQREGSARPRQDTQSPLPAQGYLSRCSALSMMTLEVRGFLLEGANQATRGDKKIEKECERERERGYELQVDLRHC